MTIRIRRARDQQFYFVVLAKNGRTIATSETYRRRIGALRGAMAITGLSVGIAVGTVHIVDETVPRATRRRRR